jgi:malic enzyme
MAVQCLSYSIAGGLVFAFMLLTHTPPVTAHSTEWPCLLPQFVHAVMARWPNAVLQFEDFSMTHALTLLNRYRG